jgi:uncharacterized protein
MRALFDVSFLIALFTPRHVHGHRAHDWWLENQKFGWASCPITQNGFVRITSQPSFPHPATTADAMSKLKTAIAGTDHQFWIDDISISDESVFDHRYLFGHRQVTDAYLLGLAAKNNGRFVTFDQSVQLGTVKGARSENLVIV